MVVKLYEERLATINKNGNGNATIVRAAHMEICAPFILVSLQDMAAVDGVSRIVCVPYFLSPGRHATEDVLELIREARAALEEEGSRVELSVSDTLGTEVEGMLGAVDVLVGRAME